MRYYVDTVIALIGAMLGALLGTLDGVLVALLICIFLDYVTGIIHAIYTKTLSSEVGFKGLMRKGVILLVVILSNTLDVYVMRAGSTCRTAVCLFYISNEGISILENAVAIGLPLPQKLKDILEDLTNDNT